MGELIADPYSQGLDPAPPIPSVLPFLAVPDRVLVVPCRALPQSLLKTPLWVESFPEPSAEERTMAVNKASSGFSACGKVRTRQTGSLPILQEFL